jgi:hypothetical protein
MRVAGIIGSFVARHAVAAGAVFVVGCVLWTVTYFALLIWASVTGGGMGSPAVYPVGLMLLLAGTAAVTFLLFLPATLVGEVLCRLRSWPTLAGIPVTLALFSVLAVFWSSVAHDLPAFEKVEFWRLTAGTILTLAIPLGVYWWAAEFPHIVWDLVKTVRRS